MTYLSPQLTAQAPRASLGAALRFAWEQDAFDTASVIEATGLTRSTAIEALDDLIDLGLVEELPNAREIGDYIKGRPARRFRLRADRGLVVGMDAGQGHLLGTLTDLRGRPLASRREVLGPKQDNSAARRAAVLGMLDSLIDAAGCSPASLLAVCVGVPAPVDGKGESPAHWDNYWRRMNPGLRQALADRAPLVRIENDALLAAVAEGARGAAVGSSDYVTLLAGSRFGAGVVTDGRLLRGRHGGVGETVAFDHVEGVGDTRGIGKRLEDWGRAAIRDGELPPGHQLAGLDPEALDGRRISELAQDGDPWASELVDRAGAVLARVVGVFGSLFDPERVILAGAPAEAMAGMIEVARQQVGDELDLPAPEILASRLGPEVVVAGAVSAALVAARDEVLRIPPEKLPPFRTLVGSAAS